MVNPFDVKHSAPIGWKRGESLRIARSVPTIHLERVNPHPFDPPGTAPRLEFTEAVKANDWLRWWFA